MGMTTRRTHCGIEDTSSSGPFPALDRLTRGLCDNNLGNGVQITLEGTAQEGHPITDQKL